MSSYESHIGKIKNLRITPEDFLDKKIREGLIVEDFYTLPDDTIEIINDVFHLQYIHINGNMFKIIEESSTSEDEDVYNCKYLGNDEYSYTLNYYNGACGFNEALEEAINKIEISQNESKLKDNQILTPKDLIKILENMPQDANILLSKDDEGNGFRYLRNGFVSKASYEDEYTGEYVYDRTCVVLD